MGCSLNAELEGTDRPAQTGRHTQASGGTVPVSTAGLWGHG